MPWIIGGAVVGSALLGSRASKSAADTQASAAGHAADISKEMFDQTRSDLMPYQQAGTMALSELQSRLPELTKPFSLQDFTASPAYQFNLEQGQKAIDKAAAARGAFYQPGTLQDISRFSQGLASNEFQNAFSNYNTNLNNIWNRLYGLTGTGQNAAAQTGGFAQGAATNIGADITGAANARAAGTVGVANALTGAAGTGVNAYLMNQILSRNQNPVISGGGYDPYAVAATLP